MRTKLFDAVENVKQSRRAGAKRGDKRAIKKPASAGSKIPFQQNPKDDGHLQHGRNLAHEARAHGNFSDGEMDDDDANENQQVAPDDRSGEPERDLPEIRSIVETQQHDAGYEQQFVGKRVENFSQFADLVVMARDVAVHAVQNRGDGERQNRKQPVDFISGANVINRFDDEKWNQKDPQDCNFVRSCHVKCLTQWSEDAKSQRNWRTSSQPSEPTPL